MKLKVVSANGFVSYIHKGNIGAFKRPIDVAKEYAKKVNGTIYYENPSPYIFMKNGKVCKGSERWLLF